MLKTTLKMKVKKQRIESKSYPILKYSFKRVKGWVYKIPDQGFIPKIEGCNRFTPKKPFDFVGVYKNKSYCIEMKGYKDIKGLSMNDLRPNQVEAFEEIGDNVGANVQSLIGYYFFQPRKLKKIIFVNYFDLARLGIIPKKDVVSFLEDSGNILGEKYINPEGGKERSRHFFPLDQIEDYII